MKKSALVKLVEEVVTKKLNETKINRPPGEKEFEQTRKPVTLSEINTIKYSELSPENQKWVDGLQQYMPNQL